jgi:hypothetical protein
MTTFAYDGLGTHHGVSAGHLARCLREWSYWFDRPNLPDGLDLYLIRPAVEWATITYDQPKTGGMLAGAHRCPSHSCNGWATCLSRIRDRPAFRGTTKSQVL